MSKASAIEVTTDGSAVRIIEDGKVRTLRSRSGCEACGKPLPKRSPSQLARARHSFCSRACSAKGVSLSARFEASFKRQDGCWPWTGPTRGGYGRLYVGQVGGKAKRRAAHRVAWELNHGPIPEGLEVCHKCDNPGCVNPDHLFLGTHAENMQDCGNKGRTTAQAKPERLPRGEQHGQTKFTDALVRQIREEYRAGGVTYRELAKAHGLSKPHVTKIIQGKTRRTA